MSGRIQIDVRTVEPSEGCDLVADALDLLETGESLHLTLDHPPGCVHEAMGTAGAEYPFAFKLVDAAHGAWKVRVRRIAEPRRHHEPNRR